MIACCHRSGAMMKIVIVMEMTASIKPKRASREGRWNNTESRPTQTTTVSAAHATCIAGQMPVVDNA